MTFQPGRPIGAYTLLSRIGSGGMGEVFKARDPRLGRLVAIKMLAPDRLPDPEARARFAREARLLAGFSHPNLLAIHDVGEWEGQLYLVTEYLVGESLAELLARGPVPERQAVALARDLARGLAAVHARGIVHRDLKPSNILLPKRGAPRILDFGLAKDLALEGTADASLPGAILGTVGYLSPEQARGEPVDGRSDLFNVGILLHEMLTGVRAFQRDSAIESLHAVLKEPPTGSLEPLPEPLRRIVTRCLEKDPEARFQSAADLAFALEGWGPSMAAPSGRRFAATLLGACLGTLGLGIALHAALTGGVRPGLRPHGALAGAQPPGPIFRRITASPAWVTAGRFSPDDRSIAFSLGRADGRHQLMLYRPGDATPMPAGLDGRLVALGQDGELFYTDSTWVGAPGAEAGGTLLSRRGGDVAPRPWLEAVQDGDLDASGQVAVVRRLSVPGPDPMLSVLEWPAGRPLVRIPSACGGPRLSPDGSRLAFLRKDPEAGDRIVVIDREGQERFVSRPLPALLTVAWVPDGSGLLCTWSPEPGSPFRIARMDLEGRETSVLAGQESLLLLDVARDGRLLVLATEWGTGTTRIHLELNRRMEPWELGLRLIDEGTCSPDGTAIAFAAREADGQDAIYFRKVDGGAPMRLGRGSRAWAISPDHAWVLVQRRRKDAASPAFILVPTGPGSERLLRSEGAGGLAQARFLPGNRTVLVAGAASPSLPLILSPDAPPQPLPGSRPGELRFAVAGEAGVVVQAQGKAPEQLHPDGTRRTIPGLGPQHIPVGWDSATREVVLLEGPSRDEPLEAWSGRSTVRLWRSGLNGRAPRLDRILNLPHPGSAGRLLRQDLGGRAFLVDSACSGTLYCVEGAALR